MVAFLQRLWMRARRRASRELYNRLYVTPETEQEIVDEFHKLYFDSHQLHGTWSDTYWLGTPIVKCPLDLWIYQELIYDLKPDVIIETGTAHGGSALYFAGICDLVGRGEIITIDIEDRDPRPGFRHRPQHNRITYVRGSSTSDVVLDTVRKRVEDKHTVMVVLDSDHRRDHVLEELRQYSAFVTPGSYVIVEDTNINGHPVSPDFGPGPMEAVEKFLEERNDFVVDSECEKFYLSFNPRGYLKRISS